MSFILEYGTVEVLYVFLLLFWTVYLYFVKDYGYWEQRGIPHVPSVFPLGSMGEVVLGKCFIGISLDKLYRKFKDERYVGFIDVRKPCLLVKEPDLIKMVLKKDFHHFMDHHWVEINPKDKLMYNLLNMKGQEWKEMRTKLTPAYTGAKVRMMYFLVKKCSDILSEVIETRTRTNNVIDVKDVLARFTTDVIATCAFGLEVNSLMVEESEFYEVGKKAMNMNYNALFKMFLYNAFPIFSKLHIFNFMDRKTSDFLTDVIRSSVEYREKHNINRYDFLDLLIKLKQNQSILEEGEKPADLYESTHPEKNEGLTIEQITAETFLFFVAGFESTSNTTLFCLYELACNCEIQDRLYSEVEEVLENHGDISYQALQEMTYMDQVINETMRRYPVFSQIFRYCTENYRVPNSTLVIEKGLKLVIPVYSLHHDPKYFPDPYTFDPERFSPHKCKVRHPFVFLPFGEGPRMCIGFRFGLMQVKTALATLLVDYTVSLAPDTDVPLRLKDNSFTIFPSKPVMLVFTKRHHKT